MQNFPQASQKFELEAYKSPGNLDELRKTHVPFSGSPLQHPHDPKKVILVPDPYGTSPVYYEFKKSDIAYAEKLPNLVGLDGENVTMVRLWVKKLSVGTLCSPFLVEDLKK